MSVEHIISIGQKCPVCDHEFKWSLSPFEARVMCSELVAVTTPMAMVDGRDLGVKGEG